MGAPVPWNRLASPRIVVTDQNGAPIPGALCYTYVTETTEPLATFQDAELSIPNKNPVVADGAGLLPSIFLQSESYRLLFTYPPNPDGTAGAQLDVWDPVSPYAAAPPDAPESSIVVEVTWDGNGVPIPAGKQGDQYVPIDCQIVAWVLMADLPGDITIDVWAAPFVTNTPPNVSNSITAGNAPSLVASVSAINTTLPGWLTTLPAGTQVRFDVDANDIITRVTLQLICQPTA